jgi:hypothetical protein
MKSHFHLWNGLMWYKRNRLYVPKWRFRDVLLKECHDGPLVGHGGAKRTITFLKKSYYWPNLKDDAKEYVKTCLTCQQNRTLNKKQTRLLWPLSIIKRSWESGSMDFMVSLPPSRDKSQWEVNFEEGNEVSLNIKKIWSPKGLNHKFLGPYAGPFKVLEKNFPDTYKLGLLKKFRVHPIFHVSLLKLVSHDASRPNQKHSWRTPP